MKANALRLFQSSLFLLPFITIAQIKTSTINVGNNNEMDITVTVNDNTGKVYFEIAGPSTKWFGAAFNTTDMSGAAYTIVSNNSAGNPVEYNMNGNQAPTLQTSQDLSNISSSTSSTTKTFVFERSTNTSNTDDYTFTTTTTSLDIAWAVGSGSSLAYHSTNKGTTSMSFTDPCTTAVVMDTLSNVNICMGDSALIFGQYQFTEGWYTDTLLNEIGCDSAIHSTQAFMDSTTQSSSDTVSFCEGGSITIFGNQVTEPGTYTDTLQNSYGCDSIASTTVTISDLETNINLVGFTLVATVNNPVSMYYWIDCSNGLIVDSTYTNTFVAANNGEYAVTTDAWNCIDTSDCITVNTIGLTEIDKALAIIISQKKNQIQLDLMDDYTNIKVILTNIHGQHIYSHNYSHAKSISIATGDLTDGIYFINILADNKILEEKVILY